MPPTFRGVDVFQRIWFTHSREYPSDAAATGRQRVCSPDGSSLVYQYHAGIQIRHSRFEVCMNILDTSSGVQITFRFRQSTPRRHAYKGWASSHPSQHYQPKLDLRMYFMIVRPVALARKRNRAWYQLCFLALNESTQQ